MAYPLSTNLKRGLEKIKQNPQLLYTIIVALLIVGAFALMSERFIGIANTAQERLVNVRIGSLQDAFVSFAGDRFDDTDYLNKKIKEVIQNNETIQSFKIITKENSTSSPTRYTIVASDTVENIGQEDFESDLLYPLATSDPKNSLTTELLRSGERLFRTARAITDDRGTVLGVAMTTQTLSIADQAIQSDITTSIWILIAVVVLIMLLFLRHSKIIDYTVLYKKLKEIDQLKDDFISMASHELRTPLSVIRGYAEFIREAPDLSTSTKDYALKIDSSARDLDSLVADILDVSRIEQGRMSFSLSPLNPHEIVGEIVSSFSIPAQEKGLTIAFEPSGSTHTSLIQADKDRFKQALVNIIGNAIKYTKQGGITVRLYIEEKTVFIRISDTGIGMSSEEQKRLFEKFYRIRTKDTEDIKGTGLGLWITGQIIKEMKGSISVESIKGVGSHFILSFPEISQQ